MLLLSTGVLFDGAFSLWVSLRISWKLSTILKTSKKIYEIMFFLICQSMHILKVYSIHYTLRKNTNVKNFSFEQSKRYKNAHIFLSWTHYIRVLLLICDSYMNWTARLVSLKLCLRFSIFDSVSFLLKFIFLFKKMHGHFDFKTS